MMRTRSSTRKTPLLTGVLLSLAALIATSLPLSPAGAATPNIVFLNPSGYSPSLTISDKADKDQSVHLVAWVQAVPVDALVEFEIQPAVGNAITLDARRIGNDVWETFASVSGLSDGAYKLRAILYSGQTESDSVEQDVTLNREPIPPPPPANTVEMSFPPNGGSLGFSAPAGKRAAGLIEGIVSESTSQVRALYTTTLPGVDPVWTECGTKRISGSLNVTVRCTLAENVTPQQVTAVALVANDTPGTSAPNPVADATGDAHRVVPYIQRATTLTVAPESVRSEIATCQLFAVKVNDQLLRPIPAANVDVHVVGPNDQIRFGTIPTSPTGGQQPTSAFQAPEKAHVSQQDGINCSSKAAAGRQGDHNIPGVNDPQHIESTTGTDDEGRFYFALYSDSSGSTNATIFVDDDDDDILDGSEVTGGARVGWGQDAPPPATELFFEPQTSAATSGSCQEVTLIVKRGGNALTNANVDVHASGPDSSVMFCSPPTQSSFRSPDQNHVGDADDSDTKHAEGETDSSGRFVFGVTSASSGTTTLVGWRDETDDDLQSSGEDAASGSIQWDISGERTVSIQSNRSSVKKGRSVTISGAIDGAAACESTQVVKLKAKKVSGGRFRTVASTTSDASGSYAFRIEVSVSKRYKAVAPAAEVCERASSRVITVRAT